LLANSTELGWIAGSSDNNLRHFGKSPWRILSRNASSVKGRNASSGEDSINSCNGFRFIRLYLKATMEAKLKH